MSQFPPSYCLKAVELGLVDPEAVIPREWIYDLCVLCPASLEDCVSFFRSHGASTEVDDNTYLALLAGGFFRNQFNVATVTHLLSKRFSNHAMTDSGLRGFLDKLNNPKTLPQHAYDICIEVLSPYQDLGDLLLAELPVPGEFSYWH
jgi:hypothetical protein